MDILEDQILVRRDTLARFVAQGVVPLNGEPIALIGDDGKATTYLIGDGVSTVDKLSPLNKGDRGLPGLNSVATKTGQIKFGGTSDAYGTDTGYTDVNHRVAWRQPVASTRWRLHVRNIQGRRNNTITGAINFTGVWVGQHALTALGLPTGNFAAAPTQALSAFSTLADGSEYVSDWVAGSAAQFQAQTEFVLSAGFLPAAGSSQTFGKTASWAVTSNASGASASASAMTAPGTASATGGLFDWFIEYEALTDASVSVFIGDSLTDGYRCSRGSARASYPAQFANRSASIIRHSAYGGAATGDWITFTDWKWTQLALSSDVGFAVVTLGTNDILNGVALATIQANLMSIVNQLLSFGVRQVFLGLVPPGNFESSVMEPKRVALNAWIRSCPGPIAGVFDFDRAVRSASAVTTIDADYAYSDGLHMIDAGYAKMAAQITGAERPNGGLVLPAPPAAFSIAAVPDFGQATVTLPNGPVGGVSYALYRGTSATGTPVATTFPFVDTGLPNGTPVTYIAKATNSYGSTMSAPVTVTPTSPTALDRFARADTTGGLGTAETGQNWAAAGTDSLGISGGAAYRPTATGATDSLATLPTSIADVDLTVVIAAAANTSGQGGFGPVWRYSDSGNYWLLDLSSNATTLYKKVGNAFSSVATITTTVKAGDTVRVVTSGSTHTVYINGTQVSTVTDAFNSSATSHGVRFATTGTSGYAPQSRKIETFRIA